jgi:predicted metalloprotease with PDZ domain
MGGGRDQYLPPSFFLTAQTSADYCSKGDRVWLGVDITIRKLSSDQKSLRELVRDLN